MAKRDFGKDRGRDKSLDSTIEMEEEDDLNLDDPFGGMDGIDEGNGRSPAKATRRMVTEGFKGAAEGALAGLNEQLERNVPNLVSVKQELSDSFNDLKDMKDEISKQLQPMMQSLENAGRKILPRVKGIMPESWYKGLTRKIDERIAAREGTQSRSKEQERADLISQEISQLFSQQAELNKHNELEERKTQLMDRAISSVQHRDTQHAMARIYDSVRSTELFHRTLHTAYMKKSLELQFKHLFVAQDTHNLLAKSLDAFEGYFKGIVKNTGLPDVMKTQASDYIKKARTEKYGTMMADYLMNARKMIFDKIKGSMNDLLGNLGFAASGIDMGADMLEMYDDPMMNPAGLKGLAARWGGHGLSRLFLGGPLKGLAEKYHPYLKYVDDKLEGFRDRMYLGMDKLRRDWDGKGTIKNFIAGFLPSLSRSATVTNDLLSRSEDAAAFDKLTRQSITEIIPGYLSKILYSIDQIKDPSTAVQQKYNIYRREFTSIDDYARDIMKDPRMSGSIYAQQDAVKSAMTSLATGLERNGKAEEGHGREKLEDRELHESMSRFLSNHIAFSIFEFNPIELIRFQNSRQNVPNPDQDLEAERWSNDYIIKVADGIKADKFEALVDVILNSLKDRDGSLDPEMVKMFQNSIIKLLRVNDSIKRQLPHIRENLGLTDVMRHARLLDKNDHIISSTIAESQSRLGDKYNYQIDEWEQRRQRETLENNDLVNARMHELGNQFADSTFGKPIVGAYREINKWLAKDDEDPTDEIVLGSTIVDGVETNMTKPTRDAVFYTELISGKPDLVKEFHTKIHLGCVGVAGAMPGMREKVDAFVRKINAEIKSILDGTGTPESKEARIYAFLRGICSLDSNAGVVAALNVSWKNRHNPVVRGARNIMNKALHAVGLGKWADTYVKVDRTGPTVDENEKEHEHVIYDAHAIKRDSNAFMKKGVEKAEKIAEELASKDEKKDFTKIIKSLDDVCQQCVAVGLREEVDDSSWKKVSDIGDILIKAVKNGVYDNASPEQKAKIDKALKNYEDIRSSIYSRWRDFKNSKPIKFVTDIGEAIGETKTFKDTKSAFLEKMRSVKGASKSKFINFIASNTDVDPEDVQRALDGDKEARQRIYAAYEKLGKEKREEYVSYLKGDKFAAKVFGVKTLKDVTSDMVAEKAGEAYKSLRERLSSFGSSFNKGAGIEDVPPEQPTDFSDKSGKSIVKAIYELQSTNTRENATTADTLQHILSRLAAGVPALGSKEAAAASKEADHVVERLRDTYGVFGKGGKAIGKLMSGVGSAAVWAGKTAGGIYKRAYNAALEVGGKVISSTWGGISRVAGWAANTAGLNPYVDIYVKGQEHNRPVLTWKKQAFPPGVVYGVKKDGMWVPGEEKVQSSPDIVKRGVPVFDPRSGNMLISEEDLEKGLWAAQGPLSAIARIATATIRGATGIYGAALRAVGGIGKVVAEGLFGKAGKRQETFVDVYRRDRIKDGPILTRLQQVKNQVMFANGDKIERSSDIHQPVYDRITRQCLVSPQDIDAGLCDVDGRPLGTNETGAKEGLFGKMFDLGGVIAKGIFGTTGLKIAGTLVGGAMHMYKGLFDAILGGGKAVGRGFANIGARLFGFDHPGGFGRKAFDGLNTRLDKIIAIVSAIRNNGIRAAATEEAEATEEIKEAEKEVKASERNYAKVNNDARNTYRETHYETPEEAAAAEGADDEMSLIDKILYADMIKGMIPEKWKQKITKYRPKNIKSTVATKGRGLFARLFHRRAKLGPYFKGQTVGGKGSRMAELLAKRGSAFADYKAARMTGAAAKDARTIASGNSWLRQMHADMGLDKGFVRAGDTAAAKAAAAAKPGFFGKIGKGFGKLGRGIGKAGGAYGKYLKGSGKLLGKLAGPLAILMEAAGGYSDYQDAKASGDQHGANQAAVGTVGSIGGGLLGMKGGAAVGAAIGTLIGGPVGTAIGSVLGGALGALGGSVYGKKLGNQAVDWWKSMKEGADQPMTKQEIEKTREKYLARSKKPGAAGEHAKMILEKFDKAVMHEDWITARKYAGMERDSRGMATLKLLGAATGIGTIYNIGKWLVTKDENEAMSENEVKQQRDRIEKLAANGNKAAKKLLKEFDDAVIEQDWRKVRKICGKETVNGLIQLGRGAATAGKWIARIGSLGMSMLFETSDDEPMKPEEIATFTKKMNYYIEKKNDPSAKRRLQKFEEAVVAENWAKARAIARMPHKSIAGKAFDWFVDGDHETPMTEAEINRTREKLERKVRIGAPRSASILEKFNDAVERQNWRTARRIAKLDESGWSKSVKAVTGTAMNVWRWLVGGDGQPMSDAEIKAARTKMEEAIAKGNSRVQKILDRFDDYVADEKWTKARKLANMPYKNVFSRAWDASKGWLLGDDSNAMSEEEIEHFRSVCEQAITDGKSQYGKILKEFNFYVQKENWTKARKISGMHEKGALQTVGKLLNPVTWFGGNNEFKDCAEMREDIEMKIEEDGDPSGMLTKGLELFDKLVKRQAYDRAMVVGRDILKGAAHFYKEHGSIDVDVTKEFRQAQEISEKYLKKCAEERKKLGWFDFRKRGIIRNVEEMIRLNPDRCLDADFVATIEDQLDMVAARNDYDLAEFEKPPKELFDKGDQLVTDIDKTLDKFSWISSPRIKWRLRSLKNDVRSSVTDWTDEYLNKQRKALQDIAGDEAVNSSAPIQQALVTKPALQVPTRADLGITQLDLMKQKTNGPLDVVSMDTGKRPLVDQNGKPLDLTNLSPAKPGDLTTPSELAAKERQDALARSDKSTNVFEQDRQAREQAATLQQEQNNQIKKLVESQTQFQSQFMKLMDKDGLKVSGMNDLTAVTAIGAQREIPAPVVHTTVVRPTNEGLNMDKQL